MENAARSRLPTQLTEEQTTGIEEIDAQHSYFLGLVKAAECLSRHPNAESERTLLLEIARYAQCHFAYEETMMDVYGYPEKNQHVAQHAGILNALKQALVSEPLNVAQMRFHLLKWLTSHIPLDDKPLAEFVRLRRSSVEDCLALAGT